MKTIATLLTTCMIIAIIFCAPQSSSAQKLNADYRDVIQMGVKLGTNYSNVYDIREEDFHTDPKFGFVTGVFVAIPLGKFIGFQPEILFSQKGFQGTGKFTGTDYDFTRTTLFADIPLLFSFKPSRYLNLVAGPQYSYLISQKDVFKDAALNIHQEEEFEKDDPHLSNLCFLGGVDLDLGHFVIGTRMGWDFFSNISDMTTTTPRYKNIWYQVTLGYRLVNDQP